MIDRANDGEAVGKKLSRLTDRLFRWWHRLEAEKVDWVDFRRAMVRLRREFKTALNEGGALRVPTYARDLRRIAAP